SMLISAKRWRRIGSVGSLMILLGTIRISLCRKCGEASVDWPSLTVPMSRQIIIFCDDSVMLEAVAMPKLFISYRREYTEFGARHIYQLLVSHCGKEAIFMDIDTIPLGVDFVEHLSRAVGQCDIVLAMIGEKWLDIRNAKGLRRLDDPSDFVRIEIHTALE